MNPDLSIVIVSYNQSGLLEACLRSIFDHEQGVIFEVVVVDNASTEGNEAMMRKRFPQALVIVNPENKGFAAANNQGLKVAKGKYLLLLNPDTEVEDGALGNSIRFLEDHPEAGIVGCKLVYPDGTVQRSVSSFPSVLQSFVDGVFLNQLLPKDTIVTSGRLRRIDYQQAQSVDCVLGAFFLFRRDVMEKIGLLDERFFMYSEETDYCWRAKNAGYQVWYTPAATAVHHWGGMSSVSRSGLLQLVASQLAYFDKNHRGLERLLLVLLKYFGLLARVVVYFLAGVVTVRRELVEKSSAFAYALLHARRFWQIRTGGN